LLLNSCYTFVPCTLTIANSLIMSIARCVFLVLLIGLLTSTPSRGVTYSEMHISIIHPSVEYSGVGADTTNIQRMLRSAQQHIRTDISVTDSLSNEAYALLQHADDDESLVQCLILLSYVNSSKGEYPKGFAQCREAIRLSETLGNQELISQSYNQLYLLYYQNGDYDSATLAAEKSLALAEEIGFTTMMARGYQNFGILNSVRGNHITAIEYFMKSEEYYTLLKDDFALTMLLGNMGVTYEESGNLSKALEYLKRELFLLKKGNNENLRGWTLVNIGAVYSQLHKPDSAIAYYNQALAIARKVDNADLMITILQNIGSYHSSQMEYTRATQFLMEALALANTSDYAYQNVYTFGYLAENYFTAGKQDSARKYAALQLESAVANGFLYDQKLAYATLSKIYAASSDYKNAYEAHVKFAAISDTLFNSERSGQIEELRVRYETEKKDHAIDALHEQQASAKFKRNMYVIIGFIVVAALLLLYIKQRSTSLKNLRLLEKEQQLEKMKSQFFANISHEFRTPLTLILGPIDLLNAGVTDPQLKPQIHMLQRNANRLLSLINQLLDLAKLESGELSLHTATMDIVLVLKGVTQAFSSLADYNSMQFTVTAKPETLIMSFDQEKIETALTNVLANAFKFTPAGGQIDVSLAVVENSTDNYCLITIRDTGMGVPADEIEQIFDRFYQGTTSNGMSSGTGIGLALTRELIALHGGTIEVINNPGAGISVLLTIPVQRDAEAMAAIPPTQDEKRDIFLLSEAHLHTEISVELKAEPIVLLIEDNADVMLYLKSILVGTYQLLEATNGIDGIDMVIEHTPDLVISDVMMPGKNGYEVCTALKHDERTSHIPIILLTAKADAESRIEGFQSRADDYITKPFIPRELTTRIQNLIQSRNRLREHYRESLVLKPTEVTVTSVDEKFLKRLMSLLEEHLGEEHFSVTELSDLLAMSRSQLHRKLKALVDQSPNQLIRSFRLQRAHDLLRQQSATTAEVAYAVGFSSPSYFSKCFHQQFGYSPSDIANHV